MRLQRLCMCRYCGYAFAANCGPDFGQPGNSESNGTSDLLHAEYGRLVGRRLERHRVELVTNALAPSLPWTPRANASADHFS